MSTQQEERIVETEQISVEADSIFVIPPEFVANRFDYPVGKPDAKGYFNAQKFGKNNHLGDDWNGLGGGNTDLGDPIYAIASGYVTYVKDHNSSWGNVIRIVHYLPDSSQVESLYAHCNEMFVTENQWVSVGDKIGTIGNAHGRYKAHLHLELREIVGLPVGGGYSKMTEGYLAPTEFIDSHRIIDL
ncbi:M23 family metallopeptidase [bacterium]|nr:M23 family metallopeptidase [bacterium]